MKTFLQFLFLLFRIVRPIRPVTATSVLTLAPALLTPDLLFVVLGLDVTLATMELSALVLLVRMVILSLNAVLRSGVKHIF